MSTGDWALVVSLCSLAVAIASFVWNVWSKFVYPKPRVQVSIGVFETFTPGVGRGSNFVRMTAVNHGPNEVRLTHAIVKEGSRPWRKGLTGLLKIMVGDPDDAYHEHDVFGRGQLPATVAVGAVFAVNMEVTEALFRKARNDRRFGFSDTYGRHHMATLKHSARLKRDIKEHLDKVKSQSGSS